MGGGDTSHICHQNHRLSEGAGEVMNEPFIKEASLRFDKKKREKKMQCLLC